MCAHRAFPCIICAVCLCDGNYPVGTFCTGFAIAGSITALSGAALVIFKVIAGLTGLMWVLYGLLAVIMALAAVIGAPEIRNKTCLALPFLFLMLHVSYGTGTVIGLIKMPFGRKE